MLQHSVSTLLSRNFLFCDLSITERDAIAERMLKRDFKARAPVCLQGDSADHFFIVISGLLKVVTSSEDGHEVVLSLLGPGMSFGEIALLDGKQRSASVIASAASTLAMIDRLSFFAVMQTHPAVRDKLVVALCGRIRSLTDRVEGLSALDIPARLARALLALAESLGTEMAGRRYLHVKVSQGELGSMVGATRESINKLMRAWEDEGIVAMVDGRVQILQPDILQAASHQR